MNNVIQSLLAAAGLETEGLAIRPVAGGDINHTYHCETDYDHYFLKLNDADLLPMFVAERHALTELQRKGGLRTPEPLAVPVVADYSALILRYEALNRLSPEMAFAAGKALARCHQALNRHYGWPHDNFIGTTSQVNTETTDWQSFFTEQRIRPQLGLLQHPHLTMDHPGLRRLLHCLDGHQPPASLLHGDLWSGNLAAASDGSPIFFDPASYFGDRETDIAMTELFGGFSTSFYRGYESVWPLDPGYVQRKDLYQLYHVLNHANLFGSTYVQQALRICRD
ncbi:fructosamine kinase family protein [Reinekea sp. G2M2-21]|uniref:fructosamine kinase family protein n=1 Tax=Reinekea sp. G2M2-21 TaxID=2788942 RepID=UPI0018ABDDFF|nr:fructosamine kinase family protein [Reinekea sp. G2M2-21]